MGTDQIKFSLRQRSLTLSHLNPVAQGHMKPLMAAQFVIVVQAALTAALPAGVFAAKVLEGSRMTAGYPVAPGSPPQAIQLAAAGEQTLMHVFVMTSHTLPPVQLQAKVVALAAVLPAIPAPHLWHMLRRLFQMNPVPHMRSKSVRRQVVPVGQLKQDILEAMKLDAGQRQVNLERVAAQTMPKPMQLQPLQLATVVTYAPLQKKQAALAPFPAMTCKGLVQVQRPRLGSQT